MSHHLITGGAGFVGSALAHRLVAEGHEVTVLDRFSRGKQERIPKGARTVVADIRHHPIAMLGAVKDVDVVWHLAYVQGTQTFYANPKDVIEVALKGIMNVLEACELSLELGPPKDFFLVSSSEVYQDPPSYPTDETVPLSVPDVTNPRYSYGGGKIASELATLAYAQAGVLKRAVIVRPHNIYGPNMGVDHVIPQFAMRMAALRRSPIEEDAFRNQGNPIARVAPLPPEPFPIQGSGEETRCFCYIDDCIDGLITLLEKGEDRNVYHLGDDEEEMTIRELAEMVAQWFGRKITVVPGELPKGSPRRRLPDISKLVALGYAPQVWFPEGLDRTLTWYRQQAVAA